MCMYVRCSAAAVNGSTACHSACIKACLRVETYQSAVLDVLEVHSELLSTPDLLLLNAR